MNERPVSILLGFDLYYKISKILHFFLIFSFALNPFPQTHPTNTETDKAPNHQNNEVREEIDS